MNTSVDPIVLSFNAAVATLPTDQRSQVCDLNSALTEGYWWLRSKDGFPIAKVRDPRRFPDPDPAPKIERLYPAQMQQIAHAEADRLLRKKIDSFAKLLGKEIIGPMQKKIEELHTQKAIDAEALDELAECLERVDALEGSVKHTKSLDDGREGAEIAATPTSRGIASALIDRDGELVLTMTDGTVQKVGRVVGRDGLSLESRELQYEPATHEIIERWTVAGATREFRYPAGGIRDRGYWSEGMEVLAGQAVTNSGSLWIALRDTRTKPCHENKADWRVGARKGRDAKDPQ